MTTEQRDKDLKLLIEAAQLADGVEVLRARLERVHLACVQADNARLKAHIEQAPQEVLQARAAAHSEAQIVAWEAEERYDEAIRENAAYLRKEAAK